MKAQIISVYDAKAKAYLGITPVPTIEVGIRSFKATVEQPNHDFGKFPEDYTLYHLGEMDEETGRLIPLEHPHPLAKALNYKQNN